MKSDTVVVLHVNIITPVELGRIQRELFNIETKANDKRLPSSNLVVSKELDALIKSIGINLADIQQRQQLIRQLDLVRKTAPIVQLTFANEPGRAELMMLVKWFRENGHPNTLLSIAVQPAIAGGIVLKTQTKTFDFSFSKLLKNKTLSIKSN